MTQITYENGQASIPWFYPLHGDQPRGYAYEGDHHFIHFYARNEGLWGIHTGQTVAERKSSESVEDWARRVFGAHSIQSVGVALGTVVAAVWRPGLYYEEHIFQALDTDRVRRRAAEQSLHSLVERLSALLLYIEPEGPGLSAFGPRSRELLILACTECENVWAQYMRLAKIKPGKQGFSTNDYVRLLGPLHLAEYEFSLVPYAGVPKIRPFATWNPAQPTQSLAWYDAYNKTKHDRETNLHVASLHRCIEAVAANVALFCVRYSPYPLYQQNTPVASLVSHLFSLELVDVDPTRLYVPLLDLPMDYGPGLTLGETRHWVRPWSVQPLAL